MQIDLELVRSQFPALAITDDGVRRIYFDNPAGTQVPQCVADAVADALLHKNANLGGYFASSAAADKVVAGARSAMADFLNAPSADEIIFGPNMTTLTLHLSRSIGQWLKPGDEIVLSRMDHDANVWPWVLMARDRGIKVKWLPFNKETFEFDLEILDDLLTDRTKSQPIVDDCRRVRDLQIRVLCYDGKHLGHIERQLNSLTERLECADS